jgi:hypothetical protein
VDSLEILPVQAIANFFFGVLSSYLSSFLPNKGAWPVIVAWTLVTIPILSWIWVKSRGRSRMTRLAFAAVSLACSLSVALWFVKSSPVLAQNDAATSKPSFDLHGNVDIDADNIQQCGEMTIVEAQGESTEHGQAKLKLKNFSGVAPGARCAFPSPSDELKKLSPAELKERVEKLSGKLEAFQARMDNERDKLSIGDDAGREALEQHEKEEFKSTYLKPARSLASAIEDRIGTIYKIPEGANNDLEAMQRASSIRLGRSSLLFNKPIGMRPLHDVNAFLLFIASQLG